MIMALPESCLHGFESGNARALELVQFVPFLCGQERNFNLLVLRQGLHSSSSEEYLVTYFHLLV